MSRSGSAWTESDARVGAAGCGAGVVSAPQAFVSRERLLGGASSSMRLRWLVAAVVLVLACGPAVAVSSASVGAGSRGLLAPGAGERGAGGSVAVRALQQRLAVLGLAPGPVDGRYGPRTDQAVMRLQAARGLPVDGIAGPDTLAALADRSVALYPGVGLHGGRSGPVRSLQARLAELGFAPGAIDGRYGPRTERAVRRFQAADGLRVDGIADSATLARLRTPNFARQQSGVRLRPLRSAGRASPVAANAPADAAAHNNNAARGSGSSSPSSLAWVLLAGALVLGGVIVAVLAVRRRRDARRPARTMQNTAGGETQLLHDDQFDPATRSTELPTTNANTPPETANHNTRAVNPKETINHNTRANPKETVNHDDTRANPEETINHNTRANPEDTVNHDDTRAVSPEAQTASPPAFEAGSPGEAAGVAVGSQLAIEHSDADGAFNLGVLLERQGDIAGALAAYRRADECGHGPAACNLGVLLEEQHDTTSAMAAYRRARQRGDANGAFNLGVLLEGQGEIASALGAYRGADESGHGPAACNLGVLLEAQGDTTGAIAAYGRAAHRGDANGAFNLGALLEERGDIGGAVAAYDRARQQETTNTTQATDPALNETPQLAIAANGGDDHRA